MTLEQDRMANPYGMDPDCTNCADLCETRQTIIHGYGDVTADFMFIRESPSAVADEIGHPIGSNDSVHSLQSLLDELGFLTQETDTAGNPVLANAFVTHLTRCRHPDRAPTSGEILNCDPFLNAELRTINPQILLPIGERTLEIIAREFSTTSSDTLDLAELHGTELRGRGFEIVPLIEPETMTEKEFSAGIQAITQTLNRDYRQTKGRRDR